TYRIALTFHTRRSPGSKHLLDRGLSQTAARGGGKPLRVATPRAPRLSDFDANVNIFLKKILDGRWLFAVLAGLTLAVSFPKMNRSEEDTCELQSRDNVV